MRTVKKFDCVFVVFKYTLVRDQKHVTVLLSLIFDDTKTSLGLLICNCGNDDVTGK